MTFAALSDGVTVCTAHVGNAILNICHPEER
jgi:hypothetical protein